MQKEPFIDVEEAAYIINKDYSITSKANAVQRHVKMGNITAYNPTLAIIDPETGEIIQVIGPSKDKWFLREEVEEYSKQKLENQTKGHQKKVEARKVGDGAEPIIFDSIKEAAEELGVAYWRAYAAVNHGTEIAGHILKKI